MFFDTAFFISLYLEFLFPLVISTVLFWTLIIPKADKDIKSLSSKLLNTLNKTCTLEVHLATTLLPNLQATRDNLTRVPDTPMQSYVMACNILLLIALGFLALVLMVITSVGWKNVLLIFLEVFLIYGIVCAGQVLFIYSVAFNYVPPRMGHTVRDILSRFAYTCFDMTLSDSGPTRTCPPPKEPYANVICPRGGCRIRHTSCPDVRGPSLSPPTSKSPSLRSALDDVGKEDASKDVKKEFADDYFLKDTRARKTYAIYSHVNTAACAAKRS